MGNDGTIESDLKLLAIVEDLEAHPKAGVTEIAERVGLPKSTVHSHLRTLEQQEYVIKNSSKYQLGLRFLAIGTAARDRQPGYDLITQKVDELAANTGERAQFIAEEHGYGVYVYRAVGDQAVETDSGVGKRVPLNAISAGKAILAFLSPDRVDEIVSKIGLPARTENTITERSTLDDELAQIREDGYATNSEESTTGLYAIGVPILDETDQAIGAVSVSCPARRMRSEESRRTVLNKTLGAVNELELNIRFAEEE
jgi:DNA-binding IclR family transcriptional regulator